MDCEGVKEEAWEESFEWLHDTISEWEGLKVYTPEQMRGAIELVHEFRWAFLRGRE